MSLKTKIKTAATLILFILIPQAVGIIGSYSVMQNVDGWYGNLLKPSFNPPSWIFAPVWTTLYILMGIASFIIWQKKDHPNRYIALTCYTVQLILNGIWTPIFFGLHNITLALINIIVLLFAVILTIAWFQKINKTAAILLIPYLLWISFATVLNYSIWLIN